MRTWRVLTGLLAVKLVAQFFVYYGLGLRVLCVDDYLRLAIASRIAKLIPSFTPFPSLPRGTSPAIAVP